MKTKGTGWKESHGIQNSGIEDSKGNMIIDSKQHGRANLAGNLELEPEQRRKSPLHFEEWSRKKN
jgi:hypothetical protein